MGFKPASYLAVLVQKHLNGKNNFPKNLGVGIRPFAQVSDSKNDIALWLGGTSGGHPNHTEAQQVPQVMTEPEEKLPGCPPQTKALSTRFFVLRELQQK